ncbi:hypothetical protein GCM10020218_014270 [Dactylosporangium vinaceum]
MPRRRPGDLRPPVPVPDPWRRPYSRISGLSGSAQGVIARLERRTFTPGATAAALHRWPKLVYQPGHPPYDDTYTGCGVPSCCPEPADADQLLQAVVRALPTRDARALRRRLAILARLQKAKWPD